MFIRNKILFAGASNGDSQNSIGISHSGNGIGSHHQMHHHNTNINPHSGISPPSHVHPGSHHHPGHGIVGSNSLADIHGLDLEAIGKLNSGNNNNNNNGLAGMLFK